MVTANSILADLRVLIVADDPLSRAGLAAVLADLPGCTVVGQIDTNADLSPEVEVYRPDVILWDLGWEPAATLERLADLSEFDLPLAVLLPDEGRVAMTLEAAM